MNKDEKYLADNGWIQIKDCLSHWNDKDNNFSRGGLNLKYALKVQNEWDLILKQGAAYFYHADRYGYGYYIGKYTTKERKPQRTEYNHLDKTDAQLITNSLNAGVLISMSDIYKKKFNQMIIFEEKNYKRYFYVPTFEDLCKVALKVFKERIKDNYWYDFDLEKPIEPEISKKDIEKLKESELKTSAKKCWVNYESDLKYYNKQLENKKLYDAALKDETGSIILQFLETREGGEYEGLKIIQMEEY